MTPPNAPSSRYVFDSPADDCVEEEVECESNEKFCLAAVARISEEQYLVQKGCVAAEMDEEVGDGLRGFNGSGCTKQFLDPLQVRNMPVALNVESGLETTVCVCNTVNLCNSGPVSQMERFGTHSGSWKRTRISVDILVICLILLLFISHSKN
jgi:hypothetical protein